MPTISPLQLDYSALTQPVSKADIVAFKSTNAKVPQNSALNYFALIFFFILCLGAVNWYAHAAARGEVNFGIFVPFIIIPLLAAAVLIGHRNRIKRATRLYKLAQANGLSFTVSRPDPAYPGMIFSAGHTREISEAFTFADGKEIGNFTYVTGGGKNRHTHTWGYMCAKLVRRLPHMVLDSKVNNMFGGRLSNLPTTLTGAQTLLLEGDFNNHFTLYAPEMYKRDALYVFTPDVMAALVDYGNKYDIEVIDDYIVFYSSEFIRLDKEESLKSAIEILDKVSSELIDQSDYYADERVANRGLNLVAEPGRRLKSRMSIFSIIGIVLYLIYLAWSFLSQMGYFN